MKLQNIERRKITENFLAFYLLLVLLLWMKTYFTQFTQFVLGVEGIFQHFLLFINPLGSALLFLGFAFLLKGRSKYIFILTVYTLLTTLLYANVVYYRYFDDFITLPNLYNTSNFGNLGGSVLALLEPTDILYFVDILIIIILLCMKKIKIDTTPIKRSKAIAILSFGLGISCLNLGLAESDRPQLLTRGFDRNYIVKYLGMYNYQIYDAYQTTKANAQRALADSNDAVEVVNFTKSLYAEPNPKFFGVAEGKNVIYVHLESIQEFLIDFELNGEEVTPFLNRLKADSNTIYFENFFHQTAQGKTADAEYMIENSIYGLPQGSAFITRGRNTYHAAPAILKDYGYTSAVFHGNGGSFWNRNEIYKSFGYDHFFDANFYEISDENRAEYGLMDKPFFEQSEELLSSLPQPFYTKFITITNHYPFPLDEGLATIEKPETGNDIVDGYFQTARYADEALEQFFQYLDETGLLENSLIIMYGDHHALSEKYYEELSELLDIEIGPVESAELQRVPLFIYMPGLEGGIKSTYGGQIDLLPTLLHLLGIETKEYVHFGTDLLSERHIELVPFRNGNYVSPRIYSVDGHFYDYVTGEEITEEHKLYNQAIELKEKTEFTLQLSDELVNGDLLRFYTPPNFTPVDRTEYDYSVSETNEEQ
ncbi:LTA synthase family protein [Pallidibacillus pasinlerensis]|uniref:LTA synthase family protein n=1 Tax=Pallidibacillus pasinlerensis TaxID=2703818 RepID=A0ABX0A2U9_9BACI|nr:LTA synthase family protein [Pallidibacillus pasinlerensis]NCU17761.1 LTA synthase family protein [Pallidibacillus pasinlerensis]